MSCELTVWVLVSLWVSLHPHSYQFFTPKHSPPFLLLLASRMSAVAIGASARRKSNGSRSLNGSSGWPPQKSPSERESGFHEPMEFPSCSTQEEQTEQTHLLAYKSAALNHINSNHVNHKVLRGPMPPPRRRSEDLSTPLGHTSSFLEVPQPSTTLVCRPKSTSTAIYQSPISSQPSPVSPTSSRPDSAASEPLYHDCKICGCERIRINVSGQYFEIRVGLLNRHPDTLLGNPKKRQQFYDRVRDEFFIDRHRPSFEAIFSYYQYGGRLKRPHTVPDEIFLSEVLFYELEKDVVDEYKKMEGYTTEKVILPENKCFRQVWLLFEYPETSKTAFCIAVLSVITTLVSIVLFCVETLPVFAQTHCDPKRGKLAPNFLDPFFIIETICTAWFTFELIIRFIVCPSKLHFWKDFKNIVDLCAIIPYYVTFINVVSTMSCASAKSSASLAFLRVVRLIRIFKLTKHSVGLQVLILTFKASLGGLGLFLVALIVCLLVFSSAIYYAELGIQNSQIQSIPDAFWWAIITMTTVGYGDKVPLGPWGKLLGSVCALVGVLTLAIPVPIITGNFNRFYIHKTGRGRPM